MPRLINLIGKNFGQLLVLDRAANRGRWVFWLCECECGNLIERRGLDLTQGKTVSCGCEKIKRLHGLSFKHGNAARGLRSSTYISWCGMLSRCYNRNSENFKVYGGRGIGVVSRWFDFRFFLLDMGERPKGKTLDRIDNNKDYSPENCRWADATEQRLNQRRMLNG